MTREEQRRLRDLKQALSSVERTLAKSNGFQYAHGYVFRFVGSFVYWLRCTADLTHVRGTLAVKPTQLDEVLWDVLEMPENRKQPKSFSVRGAFTAPFHVLPERLEVEMGGDLEAAYAELLSLVEPVIERYDGVLKSVGDFMGLIEHIPGQKLNFILGEVFLGHEQHALELLRDALSRQETGGFGGTRGSVYDYAVAYLEQR